MKNRLAIHYLAAGRYDDYLKIWDEYYSHTDRNPLSYDDRITYRYLTSHALLYKGEIEAAANGINQTVTSIESVRPVDRARATELEYIGTLVKLAKGETDGMLDALTRYLKKTKTKSLVTELRYHIGKYYIAVGDFASAKEHLEAAVRDGGTMAVKALAEELLKTAV